MNSIDLQVTAVRTYTATSIHVDLINKLATMDVAVSEKGVDITHFQVVSNLSTGENSCSWPGSSAGPTAPADLAQVNGFIENYVQQFLAALQGGLVTGLQ